MPIGVDLSKIIRNGPRNVKQVAITFDDGPDNTFTPEVLKILEQFNIPATFFVTGENAKRYPKELREILNKGHVLGNHSWDHPHLTKVSLDKMFDEVGTTNFTVSHLTKRRMRLFRPPYGAVTAEELGAGYSLGFFTINWDVDTRDWDKRVTSEQIVKEVKAAVKPGSIILMHSVPWISKDRLHALKEIVSYIKKDLGYTFVTVDKLLGIPAYIDNNVTGESERIHIVQPGDTLGKIAKEYGVSVEAIVKKNGIKNPDMISVGQKLIIP